MECHARPTALTREFVAPPTQRWRGTSSSWTPNRRTSDTQGHRGYGRQRQAPIPRLLRIQIRRVHQQWWLPHSDTRERHQHGRQRKAPVLPSYCSRSPSPRLTPRSVWSSSSATTPGTSEKTTSEEEKKKITPANRAKRNAPETGLKDAVDVLAPAFGHDRRQDIG